MPPLLGLPERQNEMALDLKDLDLKDLDLKDLDLKDLDLKDLDLKDLDLKSQPARQNEMAIELKKPSARQRPPASGHPETAVDLDLWPPARQHYPPIYIAGTGLC